jgi:isopenicillin N synthase-like dioxygenase
MNAILQMSAIRFLYADPTRGALQVLSRHPGVVGSGAGDASGVWINADPIPGCVVVNIGESES